MQAGALREALGELELPRYACQRILGDASLRRLFARVYRRGGSRNTVVSYVDRVLAFSRFLGFERVEDALRTRVDWAAALNDYLDYLLVERGGEVSRSTALLTLYAVKKWLEVNGVKVDWTRVESPQVWRLERDRVPTREELRRILLFADLADRTMVLLLLSSGLRTGTLVNLRLRDVRLEYETPMIVVKPQIAKRRQPHLTFITPEAKRSLEAYLEERRKKGEKLGPDSFLLASKKPAGAKLSEEGARERWRKLLEKAGLNTRGRRWFVLRLHTLRKYFATWTRLSGVDPWVTEFFMGHTGGVTQASYFLSGVGDLENPVLVKRLLEEYGKAVPSLTVFPSEEEFREAEERLEEAGATVKEREKRLEAKISFLKQRLDTLAASVAEVERLIAELKR